MFLLRQIIKLNFLNEKTEFKHMLRIRIVAMVMIGIKNHIDDFVLFSGQIQKMNLTGKIIQEGGIL